MFEYDRSAEYSREWKINETYDISQTEYIVLFFIFCYITDGNYRYNIMIILESNGFRRYRVKTKRKRSVIVML